MEQPQTSWPLQRPPEPSWPTSRGFGEALAGSALSTKIVCIQFQHRCVCLGHATARQGGHRVDFLSAKPPLPSWPTTFRMGSMEGGQVGKLDLAFV